jgi:hypothetical protein
VCIFVSEEECDANEDDSGIRYSDITQEYVERISIWWFGSLAAIISTPPTIAITPYIAPNVNAPESPGKILLGIL